MRESDGLERLARGSRRAWRPLARAATAATGCVLGLWLASTALGAPPAGPPYPAPVAGQRVYDYAGVFSPSTISSAEATIRAIDTRTGAQVAVYTQVKPASDSEAKAEADARALMDQWGVGRKGFDDGLVILFDLQANLRHGQVNLYAGSGFRAAFLTDADRQTIFDTDMKPRLGSGDFDGALAVALADVDRAATPEHAATLERARLVNAIVGLGCLVIAALLLAFAVFRWYTHGRDPIYIDDDSVLMPGPPEGLTPAMATLLMDDRCSARTVSAGLVDLAARGLVSFREESGFRQHRAGIAVTATSPGPLESPEAALIRGIDAAAGMDGYLEPKQLRKLASPVNAFRGDLETAAVAKGWLTGRPSAVVTRWAVLGGLELAAAGALVWWTLRLDASGGMLGAAALVASGTATLVIAWFMPARTPLGAMLRAMLAAYRRTLQKTMALSASMGEVVERRALPWVTTPDAAMAWGVAFGLNAEIDGVLRRTVESSHQAGHATGWYPGWWVPQGSAGGWGGAGATGGGVAAGLYSASVLPDVGSMMSAIGSVGSASSGGGFGGGGGGGGGGAGGGF